MISLILLPIAIASFVISSVASYNICKVCIGGMASHCCEDVTCRYYFPDSICPAECPCRNTEPEIW